MKCKDSSVDLGDRWPVFITFLLQPVGLLIFLKLCQRNNLWKRTYVGGAHEELSMDEYTSNQTFTSITSPTQTEGSFYLTQT